MEQVHPTRMNLLARRAQLRLARLGADLLNRKKDALLREFFTLAGEVYRLRSGLLDALREEAVAAVLAEATGGRPALLAAGLAQRADFDLQLRPRSLWGVPIVEMTHNYRVGDPLARADFPHGAAPAIDELAAGFQRIVRDVLDLAPRELRLRRIGEDIRRTNRKINALQQQVIPRLEAEARAIHQALEERARDDVIRLKRLKQKKGRAGR